MTEPKRILFVEDDGRTVAAIRTIVEPWTFRRAEAYAPTARAAVERLHDWKPDILVVDIGLPDKNGIVFVKETRDAGFSGPIMMLTASTRPDDFFSAFENGADGYMDKQDLPNHLIPSLSLLCSRGAPIPPWGLELLMGMWRTATGAAPRTPKKDQPELTPGECAILRWLSQGFGYDGIAAHLDLSVNTVRSYVRSMYRKMDVHNRVDACNFGRAHGYLPPLSDPS